MRNGSVPGSSDLLLYRGGSYVPPVPKFPIEVPGTQTAPPGTVPTPAAAPAPAPGSVIVRGAITVPAPTPLPVPSTGANYAGTPVPVGYPTNQFFVANDGSVWEYSAAQNTWINQGVPYNVGPSASSAPTPTPAVPATPTSLTATPITGQTQTDAYGNVWTFNGTSWGITSSPSPQAMSAGISNPPASVSISTASDTYQSILNWLSQETLISNVPNWIVAAGVSVLLFKVMQKKGRF